MAIRRKPKAPTEVKYSSSWWCDTCKSATAMTHAEMMEHLSKIHGLELKGLKCQKRMVLHLDSEDHFKSQYEVTVGKIKLTHAVVCPREANDPMRFLGK